MKIDSLQVDLQQHIGLQSTRVGVVEVYMHQYFVVVNGQRVGIIGDKPGCKINFTDFSLPLGVKDHVKQRVDEILDRESPPFANAAPILEDVADEKETDYGQEPRRIDAVRPSRSPRSRRRKIAKPN